MLRTKLALTTLTLVGAAMIAAGLAGVGASASAATSTSSYRLSYGYDAYTGLTKVARWAPCTVIGGVRRTHVINYRIRTAGVAGRVTLVKQAMARLANTTGLHFRYLGRTSYIPQGKLVGGTMRLEAARQHRATGAGLVVAWAYGGTGKGRSNLLTPTEAGAGSISWASSALSQLRIGDAAVVMKRGIHLKSGFQSGGSVGTLLLHELGHAVGLQHVTATREVMYPVIGLTSPAGYTTGDRAGLAKVGAGAGCMHTAGLPPVNP